MDNLPGKDFMDGFIKRHSELSMRNTSCVKRARGAVSRDQVKDFFKRYTKEVEGVPPTHIWNYDETNLSQNPGSVKAIFQRGIKYAEEVRDHSKTAISVMFCGSAAGEMMPPFVVYKAANLYKPWYQNGPKGARYTVSQSGSCAGTGTIVIPYITFNFLFYPGSYCMPVPVPLFCPKISLKSFGFKQFRLFLKGSCTVLVLYPKFDSFDVIFVENYRQRLKIF